MSRGNTAQISIVIQAGKLSKLAIIRRIIKLAGSESGHL
jgi:hypothetical protein